jgi:hypothetical protein
MPKANILIAVGIVLFFLSLTLALRWEPNAQLDANGYPSKANTENQACYIQIDHQYELNDKVRTYLAESYVKGLQVPMRHKKDLVRCVYKGKLKLVESNEYFMVDTMVYSFPFVTPNTYDFLLEMGERFHQKLRNTPLKCTKLNLTSMMRTLKSIASLRKRNRNAVSLSSHLHGTTFDVSYRNFYGSKALSKAEVLYLGDQLVKTIWEMRNEGKCYATYEYRQTCIHVVVR